MGNVTFFSRSGARRRLHTPETGRLHDRLVLEYRTAWVTSTSAESETNCQIYYVYDRICRVSALMPVNVLALKILFFEKSASVVHRKSTTRQPS
jgi:hypothetical protein